MPNPDQFPGSVQPMENPVEKEGILVKLSRLKESLGRMWQGGEPLTVSEQLDQQFESRFKGTKLIELRNKLTRIDEIVGSLNGIAENPDYLLNATQRASVAALEAAIIQADATFILTQDSLKAEAFPPELQVEASEYLKEYPGKIDSAKQLLAQLKPRVSPQSR